MENFDWSRFTLKIHVDSPMRKIYDAWAVPSEIVRWFLSDAAYTDGGGNLADKSKPVEKDYSYAWQWHTYDLTENGKITEANGADFFQFTFAGQCLVNVKLKPYDDGTLVELTQHNIPTDDFSKREYRLGCHDGWSFFFGQPQIGVRRRARPAEFRQ